MIYIGAASKLRVRFRASKMNKRTQKLIQLDPHKTELSTIHRHTHTHLQRERERDRQTDRDRECVYLFVCLWPTVVYLKMEFCSCIR